MMRTSFTLKGVTFKNRVLVASGTFGYGDEVSDLVDAKRLGGIVTKSLSLKPRDGNPPRRIVETDAGMLNSIGLANIGVEAFVRDKLPLLRKMKTAVVANIAASSIDEYCRVLERIEGEEGVHGYEINVSCPNVKEGGLSFGTSRSAVSEITRRLRALTGKLLIIKLTPNVTHIAEFAKAVEGEGADAVSVINTFVGMAIDAQSRKPKLSTVTGGLSGPAIKPLALAKVYESANAVSIPVFGIGGIRSGEDAIEFLLAGATAVQVGTANFVHPAAAIDVAEGMEKFGRDHGVKDLGELVGALEVDRSTSVIDSWQ